MASFNSCTFVGNLGKNPEIQKVGESQVANFTIAVTDKFKDKHGQLQEKTEWVNVVAWGALANIAQNFLHKGKQVLIEGPMETKVWDDTEGKRHYKTQIKAKSIVMLGKKDNASQAPQSGFGGPNYDEPPPQYDDNLGFP